MDAEQVAKDLEAIAEEASASIMRAELRAYARKLGPEVFRAGGGARVAVWLTEAGGLAIGGHAATHYVPAADAVRLRDWLNRMVSE